MPLRGRKRKGYPRKEEGAEEAEDGEEDGQAKGASVARATEDTIFAAGRFHDLSLAPALSDHIHGQLQVELLFAYVNSDPRATVRAVALQCLSKLASRAIRSRVSSMWNYFVLLSVVSDNVAAPALRVLAFEVLHKLSGHFVKVVARTELYHLLLTAESNFLSYTWPLRQAAFECLGSFGCNLAMLELPMGSDRADAGKSALDREFTKEVSEREKS